MPETGNRKVAKRDPRTFFIPGKNSRLRTFSSKIAKSQNTYFHWCILRVFGAEITKNLEILILATFFALNGWVWGRFSRSRDFRVSELAKKHQQNMLLFHFRRDHGTFTFCHTSRHILRFLHFPDPGFQKGQTPLEVWQKMRVPENLKSAKW